MKSLTPLILTAVALFASSPALAVDRKDIEALKEGVKKSLSAVRNAVTPSKNPEWGRCSASWKEVSFHDLNGKPVSLWAWAPHLNAKPGSRVTLYALKLPGDHPVLATANPVFQNFGSRFSAYHGEIQKDGSLRLKTGNTAFNAAPYDESMRAAVGSFPLARPIAPLMGETSCRIVSIPQTDDAEPPDPTPFLRLKEVPAPDSSPTDAVEASAGDDAQAIALIERKFLPMEFEIGGRSILRDIPKRVQADAAAGRSAATEDYARAKRAGLLGDAGRLFDRINANRGTKTREFTQEEGELILGIVRRAGLLKDFYGDLASHVKIRRLDIFVRKWRTFLLSELLVYKEEGSALARTDPQEAKPIDAAALLEHRKSRISEIIAGNEMRASHRVQAQTQGPAEGRAPAIAPKKFDVPNDLFDGL